MKKIKIQTNKYIMVTFLVLVMLVLTGCSGGENKQEQNTEQKQTETKQENTTQNFFSDREDMEEINLTELKVGGRILVMGIQNDDKSVNSEVIILGGVETDFNEMVGGFGGGIQNGMTDKITEGDQNGLPEMPVQNMDIDQRQNLPDFSNMSDEERQVMREQMAGQNRGIDSAMSGKQIDGGVRQSTIRVVGEIISLDDSSLTLKSEEGGSKLVFVSGNTKILKFK